MPSQRDSVRVMLGGDVMLGRGVDEVIQRVGLGYPLELLSPITRGADLFFINLECAISPRREQFVGEAKAYYFRAEPAAVPTLLDAGVNLVSLANNHALDAGHAALGDTLSLLDEAAIERVGAGRCVAEASAPTIVTHGDMRLGVIARCDHQQDFAATDARSGIAYADLRHDDAAVARLIDDTAALAQQVDHAIVSLHWQPNWAATVQPRYRDIAHRLVQAGARIIWGHSPHHFQGVAWIGSSVVIYSAGDLLDDYAIEPTFRNDRQLLFEATLGDAGVACVRALPIELEYAHPHPALPEARRWIIERFSAMCESMNSRVICEGGAAGEWLRVVGGRQGEGT